MVYGNLFCVLVFPSFLPSPILVGTSSSGSFSSGKEQNKIEKYEKSKELLRGRGEMALIH